MLGLVIGPVFTVLGVTGSMIAFRPELDEWLNRDRMQVAAPVPSATYASLDRLVTAARAAMPVDGRPYALVYPRTPRGVFWVTYSLPAPTILSPNQVEWHQVFLHPATAAVLGDRLMLDLGRPWRGPFVNVAQSIHRTLALGPWSSPVLAVIALLLIVSIASGLVLWWPPRGRLRAALRLPRGQGLHPLTLGVHNVVGVYTSVILAVLLLTGIHLVEPSWVREMINIALPTTVHPADVRSSGGDTPIGFDRAAAIAAAHFPDGRMWMVQYPQGPRGLYRVFRPSPRDRTSILPSRQVWLDQYSGRVLYEFGPHTYTNGDQIEQLLYPLHSGEALGWPGRIAVCLAGLAPGVLLVTGVMRWWHKRRARGRR